MYILSVNNIVQAIAEEMFLPNLKIICKKLRHLTYFLIINTNYFKKTGSEGQKWCPFYGPEFYHDGHLNSSTFLFYEISLKSTPNKE